MRARKPSLIKRMSLVRPQAQLGRAIAATLRLGNVGYENKTDEEGCRLIWLDRAMVDRLRSLRAPGESYGDVIIRVAEEMTR